MSEGFSITELSVGDGGVIGICALPGRGGALSSDMEIVFRWKPSIVLSMTEWDEMEQTGCSSIGATLRANNIDWFHLPIRDYGGPEGSSGEIWPELSRRIHLLLAGGGKILLHCRGGHGRSGMIAMRLLVEQGEAPELALKRLRQLRPGALETAEQAAWASLPHTF